jgi:hypothetical protein
MPPSMIAEGPTMPRLLCAALVLLPLLAACAPTAMPWTHPTLAREQWGRDLSACRRMADREVGWQEGDADSPFRDYDRQKAKAQFNASVSDCMAERGYLPAAKPKG